MPKPSQTFKKRQRENKLREKAQLKRDRRRQRQIERKTSPAPNGDDGAIQPDQVEVEDDAEPAE